MLITAVLVVAQLPFVAANEVAYLPGQLEIVGGIRACPDTVMELYYNHEFDPAFSGSSVAGSSTAAYSFGYVRFATTEDSLSGQDVWHLHWVGRTISHHGPKEYLLDATTEALL